MASGDTDASQLDSQLAAQGLNATASSSDDNRAAGQLGVGYHYPPAWAQSWPMLVWVRWRPL